MVGRFHHGNAKGSVHAAALWQPWPPALAAGTSTPRRASGTLPAWT